MKNYILSMITLLFATTVMVSCNDDFDDIDVNYPQEFTKTLRGVWMSEFTNDDDSEYIAVLNEKEDVPTLTIYMYGKQDDEVASGSYYVIFQSGEMEYDAEVGQLTAPGSSVWGSAVVYLSYLSDVTTLSMQLEVGGRQYVISTLKPTNTLPLYGYMLDGTGAVDDETGESDGLYYRIILNSPDRKSVGYGYFGAANATAKSLRNAEILDFYYSASNNTYSLVVPPAEEGGESETMVLTVNENYEPVLKFRGKTLVLNFNNHILSETEFQL